MRIWPHWDSQPQERMMPHARAECGFTLEGLGEAPGEVDEDDKGTKHDPVYRFIVKLTAAQRCH